MKEEKTYRQEAVVPDRGLPFKLFRFEGADGKYIREAHQHCSVEIFAVREGKADAYLGDKKYVLSSYFTYGEIRFLQFPQCMFKPDTPQIIFIIDPAIPTEHFR